MKSLVLWLLVFVALVSGFGIYRGWFTVDQHKIEQDENAGKAAVLKLEQKVKDSTSGLGSPVSNKK